MFRILFMAIIYSVITPNFALAKKTLNGAGASFPYPIYSKWFSEYQKGKNVQFNYRPIGSGGGVRQLIADTVSFGASDVPLKAKDISKMKHTVVQIPMVIGAVVMIYNLGPDAPKDLVLDGPTIAAIYLGEITKWNDQKIQKLNPKANLPGKDIMVVRRADSSGTTAIFTKYLSSVSSGWKSSVGNGKSVRWKTGFGGKGNDGVTGIVDNNIGSIGYVELAYALNKKLSYASLKNAQGSVVRPKLENISISARSLAAGLKKGDALVGDIANSSEKSAYPITSMTYLLLPLKNDNAEELAELKRFVLWALKSGDQMAENLHYAPLPQKMKNLIQERMNSL